MAILMEAWVCLMDLSDIVPIIINSTSKFSFNMGAL